MFTETEPSKQDTEKGKSPEETSNRVVVEIGPGNFPISYLHESVPEVEIKKGDKYFAVELDGWKIRDLKESVKTIVENRENDFKGNVIRADGKSLPFKNGSVDEIILPNILNDELPHGAVREIFDEALRTIKIGGKIMIFETYGAANSEYEDFIINLQKLSGIKVEEKRGPRSETIYEVTKL